MGSVNKVILIGNLGRDPEFKFLDSGQQVAKFSVACNERWKDKAGVKQERVEWVQIVAWGKLAEVCAQYLAKGRQVYIEGKLQTRKWKDKDGVERYTTEVVASGVTFLGGKGDSTASERHDTDARPADENPWPSDAEEPF